jgi:hypothetical protein
MWIFLSIFSVMDEGAHKCDMCTFEENGNLHVLSIHTGVIYNRKQTRFISLFNALHKNFSATLVYGLSTF